MFFAQMKHVIPVLIAIFFFFFIRMYLPALRLFNETGGFNDSGHASLLSAKLIVISHAVARKNDLLFLLIVMIRTTIYFNPPPSLSGH